MLLSLSPVAFVVYHLLTFSCAGPHPGVDETVALCHIQLVSLDAFNEVNDRCLERDTFDDDSILR